MMQKKCWWAIDIFIYFSVEIIEFGIASSVRYFGMQGIVARQSIFRAFFRMRLVPFMWRKS